MSKTYGDKVVVDHVSLELEEGQTLCILGESGSGKTTLLKLIAGLEDADQGTIHVGDQKVTGPEHNLVPGYKHIKLIQQNFKLSQFKTIYDNIKSATYEFMPEYRDEKVRELLKLAKLEDKAKAFPPELSGGQQQRIALGAALANEPEVALLDEPFSNLDAPLKAEIRTDVMNMLDELGMTTIFVSHDPHDAFAMADIVIVMKDGLIQQTGSTEELYKNPTNAYVASFFGPVNTFNIDHQEILVRPEEIEIHEGGSYSGKVLSSQFFGSHYVTHVESPISSDPVIIHTPHPTQEPNSDIRFSYKKL